MFSPNYLAGKTGLSWPIWLFLLSLAIAVAMTARLVTDDPCRHLKSSPQNQVISMNRAQQVYFLETQTFTEALTELDIGIKPLQDDYRYALRPIEGAIFHYGIALNINQPSYLGIVWTVPHATPGEGDALPLTRSIVCQAKETNIMAVLPQKHEGNFQCPPGTTPVETVLP